MADERSVDVDERRDPEPGDGTVPQEPACPCGSEDHHGIRIGERLSPSGAGLGAVYVCPAESPAGLRGAL
jgi:hypothetical protein